MPENLTEETFSRQLKTKFRLRLEDGREAELELDEVQGFEALSHTRGNVERFSIYFYGPGDFFLPQGTYRVEHAELGELDIFLVPVGRDQRGFRYEAAFNYFV